MAKCCAATAQRGKNRIWSECFDIPFLLRYPGKVAPQTDDLLLTPVDIMPSLLGLMGLAGRGQEVIGEVSSLANWLAADLQAAAVDRSSADRDRLPEVDGTDYSAFGSADPPPSTSPPPPSSVPFMRNRPGPQDESGMHRGYVPDAAASKRIDTRWSSRTCRKATPRHSSLTTMLTRTR